MTHSNDTIGDTIASIEVSRMLHEEAAAERRLSYGPGCY